MKRVILTISFFMLCGVAEADREYLLPGGDYINETSTREYLLPGDGYINETVEATPPAAPTGPALQVNSGLLVISGFIVK